MNYEDFKEVIHGRRSVRKFTEQEVSTSDIKEILIVLVMHRVIRTHKLGSSWSL